MTGMFRRWGCFAHARRKFVEVTALMKLPGRTHQALAFIRALYRVERQSRQLTDEERRQQRQEKSVPILTRFKAWLDEQIHSVLPKSALGNPLNNMTYLLSNARNKHVNILRHLNSLSQRN